MRTAKRWSFVAIVGLVLSASPPGTAWAGPGWGGGAHGGGGGGSYHGGGGGGAYHGGGGYYHGGGGYYHGGGGYYYGGHDHDGHTNWYIGVGPWWGPAWWGPGWWGPGYPYGYYAPYPYYPPYYAAPSMSVQQPPVYIERDAVPSRTAGYWYYCESTGAYYPSVRTCPEPWVKVPPRPEAE
jgi:hypothetical protein